MYVWGSLCADWVWLPPPGMAAAHWQLPQLAFALSQHHRVGAASPAHQLPHELVREVLLRVCAEEVTDHALVLCIGGVSDPSVHRGQLDTVEGLWLVASHSSLTRHHRLGSLPALCRPRSCHGAAYSPLARSLLVLGGRCAAETPSPDLLCERLRCMEPSSGTAGAAWGSALSEWSRAERALSDGAWSPCPAPCPQPEPERPASGVARERASAVALHDGRIMVMGGLGARLEPLRDCWVYDPAEPDTAAAWRAVAPMRSARCDFGATTLCDGTVVVAGGVDNGSRLRAAERYSPETDTWQPAGSLGQPRRGCSLAALPAALGGGALALGGGATATAGLGEALRSCERLCLGAQQRPIWRPSLPLVVARQFAAVVTLSSCVLILGGSDGKQHLRSVELAQLEAVCAEPPSDRHGGSPCAGRWELMPEGELSLELPRSQFAAVVI